MQREDPERCDNSATAFAVVVADFFFHTLVALKKATTLSKTATRPEQQESLVSDRKNSLISIAARPVDKDRSHFVCSLLVSCCAH